MSRSKLRDDEKCKKPVGRKGDPCQIGQGHKCPCNSKGYVEGRDHGIVGQRTPEGREYNRAASRKHHMLKRIREGVTPGTLLQKNTWYLVSGIFMALMIPTTKPGITGNKRVRLRDHFRDGLHTIHFVIEGMSHEDTCELERLVLDALKKGEHFPYMGREYFKAEGNGTLLAYEAAEKFLETHEGTLLLGEELRLTSGA